MRILVVGGDGMLGHQLLRILSERHDVRVTLHHPLDRYPGTTPIGPQNAYSGIDVRHPDGLIGPLLDFRPDAVINAAGIVRQRKEAKQADTSIEVNALFPHRLATLAELAGIRVICISTDCVFSGRRGRYRETDNPDPVDLYGLTKLLGEVHRANAVTLRTSMIGLELHTRRGLIEWALGQAGDIPGYTQVIYTGVTTTHLATVIERILVDHPSLNGIWHVASDPITKFDLLSTLFAKLDRRDAKVVPDDSVACDRSLLGVRFSDATGIRVPDWDMMLDDLAEEIRQRRSLMS